MNKSYKLKGGNRYISSKGIEHNQEPLFDFLTHYYDTEANTMYECLQKKIQYAIPLIKTDNGSVMFAGGWKGHNYGFTIVFKSANKVYDCVFVYGLEVVYFCRYDEGLKSYRKYGKINIEDVPLPS